MKKRKKRRPKQFLGVREIGRGKFCYVRQSLGGGRATIFRFATQREADAAIRKGIALDHIGGSPPELVAAIRHAAEMARRPNSN
jgi:hypothetical protein